MSRKCLLIGDAVASTGFARMNHAYVDGLRAAGWEVSMLGINYTGDPHPYPYDIYPPFALGLGGDAFGVKRMVGLIKKIRPDVVCVTQDPWNVPFYMKRVGNTPMVASVAVDGLNCRGAGMNGLAGAVFWTQFGLNQARLGGYSGQARVIPLGVDLEVFSPMDRRQARAEVKLSDDLKDSFIVGAVGRNQPRKRLDLTMMYFAEWVKRFKREDALLFLHVGPTGEDAFDLEQLGQYLQISNKLIIAQPDVGSGVSLAGLARMYSMFDCMISTTQGEGWGLTHMEAMACGVPCILPDWAALGEWAAPAARLVACSSVACTINGINAVGGIMDQAGAISALEQVYSDRQLQGEMRVNGYKLVREPQYRWDDIGIKFAEAVEAALHPRKFIDATAYDDGPQLRLVTQ